MFTYLSCIIPCVFLFILYINS
ncbi:hypothetical protein EGS00_06140 [Parvimonas micra]|uniref:Uncharacterized protein n=1 Tax=Parvimonas micra TaxID=33033 RepID=A0A930E1F2_9FIRM|nr:hypothetical protein [Parvimonas micra]RSB91713.1 hypothetical protein EGS00_06140 [Parvimonas micra]